MSESREVWRAVLSALGEQYDAASASRDPVTWAESRGVELWSKQREVMASVRDHRRTAVRAGHGVSKSFTAALLSAWWVTSHPVGDALVVTTAPTGRQVSAILWGELRRLHTRLGLPGTIGLDATWRIDGQLVAIGQKPADSDEVAFQGLHARHVLAVLDEAAGLPPALWDAVAGVVTSETSRELAIGNPDKRGGPFERAFEPGSGWSPVHISVLDSPAFTGEDVSDDLLGVLPSRAWVEDAKRNWGEHSPVYRSRVLGEFPATDADALIDWDWIKRAQALWTEQPPGLGYGLDHRIGADIARFGSDTTVILIRAGGFVRVAETLRGAALTETAGKLRNLVRYLGASAFVMVDDTGVGGGVTDMLYEQGLPVCPVIASASADDPAHFANVRAEAYWRVRQWLEAGGLALPPDDDELAQQLARLRYKLDSRGRILIESKEAMRSRGEPSPDRADALMLTFAKAHQPAHWRGPDQVYDLG